MKDTIQLGHGGGGRLSRDLITQEIVSRFGDGALAGLPDAAALNAAQTRLVFSTDSFVVQPLFFPGGSIGDLAVYGTVNDLAVCGARPRWLSLAMILEEGLPLTVVRRVLDAVKLAADRCAVAIVTGDTKVVRHSQCDGLYLNTAGIGELIDGFSLAASTCRIGDAVLVSGPLGDHGMAVLAAREEMGVENGPISDTAPVAPLVLALADLASQIRFMRDPTRGGAAAVLNELVHGQSFGVELEEALVPCSAPAKAFAEMIGIDLLQVACEGRVIAVCAPHAAEQALARWRALPEGAGSARIGRITDRSGRVTLHSVSGGRRFIDLPLGELLPRIC